MEYAGEPERALETALAGLERFPEFVPLMVHAGDLCRSLRRYDEAFGWWRQALARDSSYLDAVYSMAFCHEELGEWEKAHRVWTALTRELDRRGQTIERAFPAAQAARCEHNLTRR